MKIIRNYLFLFGFLSALAGCSLGPEKREAPTVFDLGPPAAERATPTRINATLLVAPIAASPWLDTPHIYYRMTFRDAGRPDAYSQSRWTQSPATLLTERLRARLAAVSRGVVTPQDGAKADAVLRLELEDFSQHYSGPQASTGNVRLRATLLDANTRVLRAQRTFTVERPAEPNAPGAVRALAAATDSVMDELTAWMLNTLK